MFYQVSSNTIDALLNISYQGQIICVGSPNLGPQKLKIIQNLISQYQKVFLFLSGENLINHFKLFFKTKRKLENVVYQLGKLNRWDHKIDDIEVIRFDEHSSYNLNEELLTQLSKFYNYNENSSQIKDRTQKNTHFIILNNEKQIIAGARSNAQTKQISVIGGVKVISKFRNQGLGYKISYEMTKYLQTISATVALETDLGNFPARKIYEKIGYIEVGYSMFVDTGIGVIDRILGERDY